MIRVLITGEAEATLEVVVLTVVLIEVVTETIDHRCILQRVRSVILHAKFHLSQTVESQFTVLIVS